MAEVAVIKGWVLRVVLLVCQKSGSSLGVYALQAQLSFV